MSRKSLAVCFGFLCASASAVIARSSDPACSAELQLALVETAPMTRLVLDATVSGSFAVLALDTRTPPAFAPQVLHVGWHDGAQATPIELRSLAAARDGTALRAVLVPAGCDASQALSSAPLALYQGARALAPTLASTPLALVLPMRVRSCAFDCSSGSSPSGQISCGVINTFQNADLSFRFTLPVEPNSVSAATFQINDSVTGAVPLGTFQVDPIDPRTLYFRPRLSFDLAGNPVFAFAPNGLYQVRMPGFAQGDLPPFLMSTTALLNQNRVQCTIATDQGVTDYVPGAPHATLTVEVVTGYDPTTGVPNAFATVPAANATNVWVDSKLTIDFDDAMHVATLVDPGTGVMPFISVKIDADGDLNTTADQYAQLGSTIVLVDVDTFETRFLFDPFPSWPHSGTGPSPLLVVVDVPSAVKDIAGNGLANPTVLSFQTEP